jgi:hypothetical protein
MLLNLNSVTDGLQESETCFACTSNSIIWTTRFVKK